MGRGPGRDQLRPMGRLVRLMLVLDQAGTTGATAERLVRAADYGDGDPTTQLGRDLRHLREQGWLIENIAEPGAPARYRMTTGDNRLRLALDDEQRAALTRAMILADRGDLAARLGVERAAVPGDWGTAALPQATDELTACLDALRLRSRLRCVYKGTSRVLDAVSVRVQRGRWYLTAVEVGAEGGPAEEHKHFVVDRMSDVALDPPGTASPPPDTGAVPLHPLAWKVDPPATVVLRVPAVYRDDVENLLLAPDAVTDRGDGSLDLAYTVTHRAALRARLYALGPRVRVVSPDDVREELLAELREIAG